MLQQQVYILNNVRMAMDAVGIIGAGYAAFYVLYYLSYGTFVMDGNMFVVSVMVVMFLNNYVMGRNNLYSDARPPSFWAMTSSIIVSIITDFSVLATGIFLLEPENYPRDFLALFALFSLVIVLFFRGIERFYTKVVSNKGFNVREILVVGNMARGKIVSELLARQLSWGHDVIGRLTTKMDDQKVDDAIGTIEDLPEILKEYAIDEVIFALEGDRNIDLSKHLKLLRQMGIPARILPALWSPGEHALSAERCQGVPFLTLPVDGFNATGLMYKRILDIIGGLVGVLIFLLVYPILGILIKLDCPGPILFKQERMGMNGRVFKLFKFRTMCVDAEEKKKDLMAENVMNGAMFKMSNDPRTTKFGQWLRNMSIDEIPQFINVLKGEMSLVGTRPPTLDEVRQYEVWQRRRISAKPGITGLWQVSGRNKITDFDSVVELDCKYLDSWRFSDDIKIILKTILVVLQRKGAI